MTTPPSSHMRAPLVVAVGGGKGGVGKSVVAANLALCFAKLDALVTLVDADFGSANLHTMLGIDRPGLTLQALLDGRVKELSEVVIPSGFANLELAPGSVAVPGAANLHHARKHKLIRQIKKLPCDVAVIDCGAGIHHNTVDLFTAADVQLLVASPQLVSLQNAYGFLKASVYRMLRQRAQELDKLELMESASDKSEVETTTRLLTAIRQRDPALADELTMTLANASCVLLGNQLSGPNEINALHALSRMINDFLRLRVPVLGGLQRRDRIHAAVSRRKPFALDSSDPEARLLLQVAQRLLTEHSVTRTGQRGAEQTRDFPVEGAARVPIHESGIEYRGEAGTGQTNADAPPPPARLRTS